jgi:hypothetical protein
MSRSTKLPEVIHVSDGRALRTLADARDFLLSLLPDDAQRKQWQDLAFLLLRCEDTGDVALISVTTGRLKEALTRHPEPNSHQARSLRPPR